MFYPITDIVPKKYHIVDFQSAPANHFLHIKRCTKSREIFLSDWQECRWTEDDFLRIANAEQWQISCAEYMLSRGYWAIISDIIRMYALYTEGGLYVDWDVEFLQTVPEEMRMHKLYLGLEPYTLNGRGTPQVGMQCCLSAKGHGFWQTLFSQVRDTLWSVDFDILPGSATRLLERDFGLSSMRSENAYYYLADGICIVPHDIFYPYMGTRENDNAYESTERIVYNKVQQHTIALHWEYSQIKDEKNEKHGWTKYLHKLKVPLEAHESTDGYIDG